jgi:hypothetical protein
VWLIDWDEMMSALVLSEVGGPENLAVQDVDTPQPGTGEVRVAIKAAAKLNARGIMPCGGENIFLVRLTSSGDDLFE